MSGRNISASEIGILRAPAAGTSSADFTIDIGAAKQDRIMVRAGFDGTFNSEVSKTNVASYTIYKNGSAQGAMPWSFVKGDRLYFDVTRTTPGSAADVVLDCAGITSDVTFATGDTFYSLGTRYTENVAQLPSKYLDTDQVYQGTGNTTNYLTNWIGNTNFSGSWRIYIPPGDHVKAYMVCCAGANDGSVSDTVASRYPRMRYCFFVNTANSRRIYELGVSKSIVGDNSAGLRWMIIEGTNVAGTGTVRYYYSNDNLATETLEYTSADNYNGVTDVFNADSVYQLGEYGIFESPQIAQL